MTDPTLRRSLMVAAAALSDSESAALMGVAIVERPGLGAPCALVASPTSGVRRTLAIDPEPWSALDDAARTAALRAALAPLVGLVGVPLGRRPAAAGGSVPAATTSHGGAPSLRDRTRGALLGLAAGDALGTTVEFKPRGTFPPVTDIVGGGPFDLQPGEWTDDTSMALCLAESLVECGGFDPADQMRRYLRWWREGHLSSNGRCFDIGNTTARALAKFERDGNPLAGPTSRLTAGNGSLMRLAPLALHYHADPETAIRLAGESSRTTHGAPQAVSACRLLAALLVGALQGRPRSELLDPAFTPVPGLWEREPLHPEIAAIRDQPWADLDPDSLPASGYVVHTMQAALWAFATTESFEAGALQAVNLGEDADTTGAVYGQLAGAHYGEQGIPERWRARLAHRALVTTLADRLGAPVRSAPTR